MQGNAFLASFCCHTIAGSGNSIGNDRQRDGAFIVGVDSDLRQGRHRCSASGSSQSGGEAIRLRLKDVNLASGILTIDQGKFRKDRLVPTAASLRDRLEQYVCLLGDHSGDACLFPSPASGPYHRHTIYYAFRQLLWECRIPHGGRGQGPRLHDLRHI